MYIYIYLHIYICINRSLIYFIMMSYCIYMVYIYIYTCRQMIYISIYLDEYSMGYDGIWIVQTWMNYNDTHIYIYTYRWFDIIYTDVITLYIYIYDICLYIYTQQQYILMYIYGYTSWFVLCVGFPNIQYTQREDWLSIGPCPMKTTTALLGIQSAEFLTLGSYPLVN